MTRERIQNESIEYESINNNATLFRKPFRFFRHSDKGAGRYNKPAFFLLHSCPFSMDDNRLYGLHHAYYMIYYLPENNIIHITRKEQQS